MGLAAVEYDGQTQLAGDLYLPTERLELNSPVRRPFHIVEPYLAHHQNLFAGPRQGRQPVQRLAVQLGPDIHGVNAHTGEDALEGPRELYGPL